MSEAVRLVIWDFDETLWHESLSEENTAAHIQTNRDIVMTLARRGIMSSICSRNDPSAAQAVLEEHGIWQYFIFPSIEWSAKAARIRSIVGATQLRPSTVLVIDDNPQTRSEATQMLPGLRAADRSLLPGLLADPAFSGQDDSQLTRLSQYKVLERRTHALRGVGPSNESFLRASNIRVFIEPNIELHAARAVELINRTHQLNFTKARLPSNLDAAIAKLLDGVRPFDVQAGLIRVADNYGDYGYCGFYRISSDQLLDYCFSCRIRGLGIETWLYQKLGRPALQVMPSVALDPTDPREIDWINLEEVGPVASNELKSGLGAVRIRGGCELEGIAHYFRVHAKTLTQETNLQRGPFFIRKSCTPMALIANRADRPAESLTVLGYAAEDIRSEFLAPAPAGTLLIYTGWGDVHFPLFRHRATGDMVPCEIIGFPRKILDIAADDLHKLIADHQYDWLEREQVEAAVTHLKADFDPCRVLTHEELAAAYNELFDRIPRGATLVVVLPAGRCRDPDHRLRRRPEAIAYNSLLKGLAARRPNVCLIEIDRCISSDDEIVGVDHFSRIVYFRLFQMIWLTISESIAVAS